jgi:hypothetical protein
MEEVMPRPVTTTRRMGVRLLKCRPEPVSGPQS